MSTMNASAMSRSDLKRSVSNMPFDMPKVDVGTPVRWYKFGMKDHRPPEMAFVVSVSHRSVDVRTAAGQRMDTVRHLHDPKLSASKDQRESGAWDFTEEHYKAAAWSNEVEKRLSVLESRLKSDSKLKTLDGPTPAAKYHELRKQAIAMGIDFAGNPPKQWLLDQMALKEANDGGVGTASNGVNGQSVAGEAGDGQEDKEG